MSLSSPFLGTVEGMQARILGMVRTAVAAGAVGTLLISGQATAAAPAATPRTASTAAAPAERAAAPLRIGTFNIDAKLPLDRWRQAAGDFIPLVDIGGMQEVAGRQKAAALRSVPGIDSYVSNRFLQEPIFWNTNLFTLIQGRSPRIAKGRYVEGLYGHGTLYRRSTLATVVRLRSRTTGRTISVIDVHLIECAVDNGKRVRSVPRRFAMYKDEVRGLGKVVAQEKKWAQGPVWLLGDFNDNYAADKRVRNPKLAYAAMRRRHLVASWEAIKGKLKPGQGSGARGKGSYLDVIWSTQHAASVSVLREERFHVGQHYPVVSTYPMP